jgi:hypothetical protein
LARDGNACVFCGKPAVDSHHIIERRLFENGGYFIENGASVCQIHHLECEMTTISVEAVREACGITHKVIPEHLYDDHVYDKWGNVILPDGHRMKGELFSDESVQKILKAGGVLDQFKRYYKYPRTYHLPHSPGMTDDDKLMPNFMGFRDTEIVISEKMDGENCLDENTIIDTDYGQMTIKDICQSNKNISVLSRNIKTNENEYQPVIAKNVALKSDDWYEIEIITGEKLILTGAHLVWVENENTYKKVEELNGDEIVRLKD